MAGASTSAQRTPIADQTDMDFVCGVSDNPGEMCNEPVYQTTDISKGHKRLTRHLWARHGILSDSEEYKVLRKECGRCGRKIMEYVISEPEDHAALGNFTVGPSSEKVRYEYIFNPNDRCSNCPYP